MSDLQDMTEAIAQNTPTAQKQMNMVEWAENFRNSLKYTEQSTRSFVKALKETQEELYDKSEMIAQTMLALRHLEDARMRFGKVIQYAPVEKQGESCYTK